MSASFVQRLIVRAYPEHFRRRYGEELATVVADSGGGLAVTFDLAVSAVKARLSGEWSLAEPGARRQRLEATTTTVFSLWAWSAVAVAVFARAVNDHPVPGLTSWGWGAYAVGNVIFSLAAAAIAIIGFLYWLAVIVPAIRARDRVRLQPAITAPAVVALWFVGTAGLALATHHIRPGNYRHITAQGPHTAAGWLLLGGYCCFTAACMVVCTVSARRALKRAELSAPLLSLSSLAAVGVAVSLVATTACVMVCVTRVMMVGGVSLRNQVGAIGAVCFLLLTSVAASNSSRRGLRAVQLRAVTDPTG